MKTVVVLGASDNPERYSNKAFQLLLERGYYAVPVNPSLERLGDTPVAHTLAEIPKHPDALTVYVNPTRSTELGDAIIDLLPKVVIFNPGAENPELVIRLQDVGIRTIDACSVVLLTTGRFEEALSRHEI